MNIINIPILKMFWYHYVAMIVIYTSPSCASCKKVLNWFINEDIPYEEKSIFSPRFSEEDIKDMLLKSENGTDDIISKRSKIIINNKINIDEMKLNELVKFIKENPTVLKRPIIVDDHRLQTGYNEDEITTFLPHAKRLAIWACNNCPERNNCDHPHEESEIEK